MSLLQLVYVSAAATIMSPAELAGLLAVSRRNNHEKGVGGILVHHSGSFLQVLEGPPETVEAIFRTIEADPRHRRVIVLARQATSRATFSDWSMGFVDSVPATVMSTPGFKDFSHDKFDLTQLERNKSRAFYLLEAFSVGRLRQYVAV